MRIASELGKNSMTGGFRAETKNLKLRLLPRLLHVLFLLASSAVHSAEPRARVVPVGESITKSAARRYRVHLSITTPLKYRNVPLDPTIDFGAILKQAGAVGVFDPNSIAVINVATGDHVPFARNEDFAYSDRGRLEWVVSQSQHTEYEIRFNTADKRPTLLPQVDTPAIGVGDLLRYNARRPRPITLFYSMGLHDLTGDGQADLVGTWNYAHRPGRPWDGIVCYARVSSNQSDKATSAAPKVNNGEHRYEFSDLTRLRYSQQSDLAKLSFFGGLYSSADFADFNGDGRLDLVSTRSGANAASFYLNTGKRDIGGLPIFTPAGTAKVADWQACRAVDLNGDGAVDVIVDGQFVKNVADNGWPFKAANPVKLDAGRQPCFFDVDRDGLLDAVCLHGGKAILPDFYRVAWRKNLGGDPPKFGQETLIGDIGVQSSFVSSYVDGTQTGLLVQHNSLQEISVYQLASQSGEQPRFKRRGRAESVSAAMSFSDQAWPCLCDWDDDGDVDLLVGSGYGWPRIVINEGTRTQPRFAEPRLILADGKPIRLVRDQILGQPHNWHNMGYSYPDFVDWDGDGLRDLVIPNETNRIFWYRNMGTRKQPKFGPRRQILCDGFPDSPELRKLSAQRAFDPKSNNGVYPFEKERPFLWRTGAAIADFNGDGLTDLVTHDGLTRKATLFAQYRHESGQLKLRKARLLKLADGRTIDDQIVARPVHWTESFRAVDWNGDGLQDLMYSLAGAHHGTQDGGSIYLLENVGTKSVPKFAAPKTMRCFGEPIRITNHGPNAWPGDFDGDGNPDLVTCVEWSVYPYYSHAALMMNQRPVYKIGKVEIVSE